MSAKPTIQDFNLQNILLNPYQARTVRSKQKVVELAVSILAHGLQNPPVGRLVNKQAQLANGAGRYAAFCMIAQVQRRLQNDQSALLGEFGVNEPTDELQEIFSSLVALAGASLEQSGIVDCMPVSIVEFSDRQMFEAGIAENLDREDINWVDLARSMKAYQEKFGASSNETGQLYHMSANRVRSLVRLLELPKPIQERMEDGSLSANQATKLLVLHQVSPHLTEKAAKLIKAEQSVSIVDNTLASVLTNDKNTVLMWRSGWKGSPLGGYGLFPIEHYTPAGVRTSLDTADLVKKFSGYAQGIKSTDDSRKPADTLAIMFDWIQAAMSEDGAELEGVKKLFTELYCSGNDDLADWVFSQVRPPACSACRFHRVLSGDHYCGSKPCHSWKSEQFAIDDTLRIATETGFPVYLESDGDYMLSTHPGWGLREDGTYGMRSNPFDSWIENKNPDLRIKQESRPAPWVLTDSIHACFVVVGQTRLDYIAWQQAIKDAEAERQNNQSQGVPTNTASRNVRKHEVPVYTVASLFLYEHIDLFLEHFSAIPPQVAGMLIGMIQSEDGGVMDTYTDTYYTPPDDEKDYPAFWARVLTHKSMMEWITNSLGWSGISLEYIASSIKDELADSLNAELPDNWISQARDYEQRANQEVN